MQEGASLLQRFIVSLLCVGTFSVLIWQIREFFRNDYKKFKQEAQNDWESAKDIEIIRSGNIYYINRKETKV